MTRRDPASLLLAAAVVLLPLLSWGEPPWAQGAFFTLLAGSAAAAALFGARPARLPLPLPAPMLIAFALAFLLGSVHLLRLDAPYHSISFLFLVFWGFVFLLLCRRAGPEEKQVLPLVLAWTGGEAALLVIHVIKGGPGQPKGTFTNPNHLAAFFAASLAFLLGSLMQARDGERRTRALLWGASLFSTACLLAAGSRSGLLVALVLWGFFAWRERGARRWAAVGILAGALLIPSAALHRAAAAGDGDPYAFTRTEIWRMGVRMGADHPLLGTGPGLFRFAAFRYIFPVEGAAVRYGRMAHGPHADMIRAWSEGGAVGVTAVVLFLIPALLAIPRAWRTERAGPALALAAMLLQGFFHDLTLSPAMVFLMLWWVALLLPPAEPGKRAGRAPAFGVLVLAAVLAAGAGAADLAGQGWWRRGRDAAGEPMSARVEMFLRGAPLSPLHPEIAGDLGAGLAAIYGSSRLPQVFDAAAAALSRAHRLNRLDPIPLHRLAALYAARAGAEPAGRGEDLAQAEDLLGESLALFPRNVFAVRTLARVKAAQGREGEAALLLARALADEPDFLAAHRDRVRLLRALPGADAAARARAEAELAAAEERVRGKKPAGVYEILLLSGN